jgi:hypothetical protein
MMDDSTGVMWNDKVIVKDLADEEIENTNDNQELSRGTEQWIGIAQCTITMTFTTTDLEDQ